MHPRTRSKLNFIQFRTIQSVGILVKTPGVWGGLLVSDIQGGSLEDVAEGYVKLREQRLIAPLKYDTSSRKKQARCKRKPHTRDTAATAHNKGAA